MIARENAYVVAVEALLSRLRTPSIEDIATNGIRLQGDELDCPMVLIIHQDGQGGPVGNVNGEEILSNVYLNILAVTNPSELTLADQIDREIRKVLLGTHLFSENTVSRGIIYSVTLIQPRSYVGPGLNGVGRYLYHGGYYRLRAQGNELQ